MEIDICTNQQLLCNCLVRLMVLYMHSYIFSTAKCYSSSTMVFVGMGWGCVAMVVFILKDVANKNLCLLVKIKQPKHANKTKKQLLLRSIHRRKNLDQHNEDISVSQ